MRVLHYKDWVQERNSIRDDLSFSMARLEEAIVSSKHHWKSFAQLTHDNVEPFCFSVEPIVSVRCFQDREQKSRRFLRCCVKFRGLMNRSNRRGAVV